MRRVDAERDHARGDQRGARQRPRPTTRRRSEQRQRAEPRAKPDRGAAQRPPHRSEIQVYAERHPADPVVVKVTEATLTYVATNLDGSKRELLP